MLDLGMISPWLDKNLNFFQLWNENKCFKLIPLFVNSLINFDGMEADTYFLKEMIHATLSLAKISRCLSPRESTAKIFTFVSR